MRLDKAGPQPCKTKIRGGCAEHRPGVVIGQTPETRRYARTRRPTCSASVSPATGALGSSVTQRRVDNQTCFGRGKHLFDVTPSEASASTRPSTVGRITASPVTTRSTRRTEVIGSEHCRTISQVKRSTRHPCRATSCREPSSWRGALVHRLRGHRAQYIEVPSADDSERERRVAAQAPGKAPTRLLRHPSGCDPRTLDPAGGSCRRCHSLNGSAPAAMSAKLPDQRRQADA